MASWKKVIVSGSAADLASVTLDTQLAVAEGGTGATTLTDGGVLLGSGTGAITATAVLTDGQMLVGDGTTDPAIESGATLRTSIGVGTGDSPQFTDLTLTGGDITISGAATDIDVIDNNTSALSIDAAGKTGILEIDSTNSKEQVKMSGGLFIAGNVTASASTVSASAFIGNGAGLTNISAADLDIDAFSAGTALHQTQDHFLYSDNGTEKKITFSNVEDAIFGNVSGDATVAAGGALTIAANSVEGTMLNTNSADTSTLELSSDTLSVLKVPNAITVDNATIKLDSGTTYDGSGAKTISIKDGGVDADALAAAVAGGGLTGGGGSALAVGAGTGVTVNANDVAIGQAIGSGDSPTFTNLTLSGNLTVNGSTTAISSSNLLIADRFALFNSGSGATGDGGFLVGSGSAGSGSAFLFDDSTDRFGVQIDTQLAQDATTSTPEAYASMYVLNANTGSATYTKKGNIKVDDGTGDIFIYS